MPQDFYDLFDIDDDAGPDAVESAYRQLVKEYHPDRSDRPDAEEKFKTIQKAYDVLSDADERHKYDALGHDRYVRSYMNNLSGFEFTGTPETSTPTEPTGITTTTTKQRQQSTSTATSTQETTSTTQSSTTTTSTTPVDIPFKPKLHRSIVVAVSAILSILFAYLYGAFSFVTANRAGVETFATALLANPLGTIGSGRFGIQRPTEFVQAALTDPTASVGSVLFLVGAVALPLTAAAIVWRLGGDRPSLWLYVLGNLPPIVTLGLMIAFDTAVAPTLGFALYLVCPVVTVAVFISDIMSYIIRKYIEFYIAYYNLTRFVPW